jgi:hypothetical protein
MIGVFLIISRHRQSMDLKHLPVFEKYPFDGYSVFESNLPVVETACFELEYPNHSSRVVHLGYMVGRSPGGEEIYYSSQSIRGKDGNLFAVSMAGISGSFLLRFLKDYRLLEKG